MHELNSNGRPNMTKAALPLRHQCWVSSAIVQMNGGANTPPHAGATRCKLFLLDEWWKMPAYRERVGEGYTTPRLFDEGKAIEGRVVCRAELVQNPSQLIAWGPEHRESLSIDHVQEPFAIIFRKRQ